MEPEILFRGKRLDNGEWVYGIPATFINVSGAPYTAIIPIYSFANDLAGLKSVDPATVGQYTGLTDKNGVKIFKGDILRTREWEGQKEAAVIFESGMFKAHGMSLVTWTINPGDYNCEVVGNIHDSPELLEVQNETTH